MIGTKPRFLLGVGAQKSGTTWLYDYLQRHPATDMGFRKEYHIFDALYVKEPQIVRDFLQRRLNRLFAPKRQGEPRVNQADIAILKFLGDPNLYFDYFADRVSRSPDVVLTGDITPSYSALQATHLSYIRSNIESRGMEPKVVFLMRDPVDRCISCMRMDLRNARRDRDWDAATENRVLAEHYKTQRYQIRGRYDRTISQLERAFDPAQVHLEFYENLFTEPSIRRLCEFLDIPYRTPDLNHAVNVSRTSHPIDPQLIAEIREHYQPVYQFVRARFGADQVDRLWPRAAGMLEAPAGA